MAVVGLIAGGAGAALGGLFGNGGNHLSISTNITNSMMTKSILSSATNCVSTIGASQTIKVVTESPTKLANESTGCLTCLAGIETIIGLQGTLNGLIGFNQKELGNTVDTNGKGAQDKSFDDFMAAPCSDICRDSVVNDISQSQELTLKNDCNVENNFDSTVQQNMKSQIESSLSNQEDIFGQLESTFAGTKESVSTNIANVMSQNLTKSFVNSLSTTIANKQAFSVSGTSIYASNITQKFTSNVVGSLKITNSVVDQMTQSTDFSIAQSVANSNDTIGDLANDFLNIISSVSNLLNDLTGQLLMILSAIIVCIILIVGSLYVFSSGGHNVINEIIDSHAASSMDSHVTKLMDHPAIKARVASAVQSFKAARPPTNDIFDGI